MYGRTHAVPVAVSVAQETNLLYNFLPLVIVCSLSSRSGARVEFRAGTDCGFQSCLWYIEAQELRQVNTSLMVAPSPTAPPLWSGLGSLEKPGGLWPAGLNALLVCDVWAYVETIHSFQTGPWDSAVTGDDLLLMESQGSLGTALSLGLRQ